MREDGLGSLIARIAVTDQQTGVLNHKYFLQQLDRELARCKRYGHPMTLVHVIVDAEIALDTEEAIKRSDEFLREFSQILSVSCRNVDMVARQGVTSFEVALLETGAESATAFVQRVQAKVAGVALPGFEKGEVTLSIGSAADADASDDARQLSAFARSAAQRSSKEGGNRWCTFDSTWDSPSVCRTPMQ
jgi:two-component system, cell cycle response regulator